MPRDTFTDVSQRVINNYGIRNGILVKGHNIEASRKVISTVAKFFMVSQKATQIRMSQLGLLVG